jgi:ergothioneine biosynthesis protein EgtB
VTASGHPALAAVAADDVGVRFRAIRAETNALAAPLSPEDCQIQSMPDASPTKWHLAHTSWFFETFILKPLLPGYKEFDPAYAVLFNSYYVGVGARHPRPQRGLLSRPGLSDVMAYRNHVDAAIEAYLDRVGEGVSELFELGLHHEQQHQELILMDALHALSCNPLEPAYRTARPIVDLPDQGDSDVWLDTPGGLVTIGHSAQGFAFDNEGPAHRAWVEPCRIASRLVTCGAYTAFIADGGYNRPPLWLSDGWDTVQAEGWSAPLYWEEGEFGWTRFSLSGRQPVNPAEPVTHISYYEADAFARWAGCRLPTEQEWEVAASALPLEQVEGSAWQWTRSPYVPYPGFVAAEGPVGEYNGKFMANQMVLRGGSSATPQGHTRITYRNFFPPTARWVFSGVRLARDA